ncbi:trypsin-1-like [Penaeus japonicus]|uniref:trypsin-1-like n=1 Tax=Penaeus japonicus TaxID=27405 RepID=UPI001C70DDBE|nr:trypsin-1-like [Penaeus japonicus]
MTQSVTECLDRHWVWISGASCRASSDPATKEPGLPVQRGQPTRIVGGYGRCPLPTSTHGSRRPTTVANVTLFVPVKTVILHEKYDPKGYDYDIALLRLSRAVCLPADDTKTYAGMNGIASGWGALRENGTQPNKLMEVTLPILNPNCWDKAVTDRMLCAGLPEGGKDTCQGDSGGPLCVQENNKYVQVGVVSFGEGCAKPRSPGFYARVSKFLSWIKEKTSDATYC